MSRYPCNDWVGFTWQSRLPPEVNRILFVRNLPFKITSEELYDLFGRYGAIRQIRKCSPPPLFGPELTNLYREVKMSA